MPGSVHWHMVLTGHMEESLVHSSLRLMTRGPRALPWALPDLPGFGSRPSPQLAAALLTVCVSLSTSRVLAHPHPEGSVPLHALFPCLGKAAAQPPLPRENATSPSKTQLQTCPGEALSPALGGPSRLSPAFRSALPSLAGVCPNASLPASSPSGHTVDPQLTSVSTNLCGRLELCRVHSRGGRVRGVPL